MTNPRFIPTISVDEAVHAFDALEDSGIPVEQLHLLRAFAAYQYACQQKLFQAVAWLTEWEPDFKNLQGLRRILEEPIKLHPELATPEVNHFMATEYQPPVPMEDILRDNPRLQQDLQKAAAAIKEMQGGTNYVPAELPETQQNTNLT